MQTNKHTTGTANRKIVRGSSAWQPINTAPRRPLDKVGYGPEVMLFVDDRPGFGYWDRDFDKFYVEYPEAHRGEPTHWMPLPEPPNAP